MSSRRSSALGLFLVSVLTVISALRQSSRITHRDVFRFQRAGRAYSNVTPEKPTVASCFVRNGTTGLRELGDAYLLSRGSSHLGTLRALKFSLKRALRRGELRIGVAGGSVSVGGGCYEDPEKMWFNNVQREVSNKLQDIGLNVTVKISSNTKHAVNMFGMFYRRSMATRRSKRMTIEPVFTRRDTRPVPTLHTHIESQRARSVGT